MTKPPPFAPGFLLSNRHVQTLCAALPVLFPSATDTTRERLRIPVTGAHGDEALHAEAAWQPRGPRPTALLVHGMGGSSRSAYVLRAARAIAHAGHHVVSLDLRGSGRGAEDAESLYHAGMTEDLDAALAYLGADPRVSSVVLVGFSLGGQTSLLAASRWGNQLPQKLQHVVAISPPLDLAETSRRIEAWRAYPYKRHVLRGLTSNAIALKERAPPRVALSIRELRAITSIREYDDRVIAPMHGFAGADDYYAQASSGPRLGSITVPTLLVGSDDDPMVPGETMRPFVGTASSAVDFVLTPRGGHVGYVERGGDGLWQTWTNRRIVERLDALAATST